MYYILILILIALVGGPWLVAAALTLTGIWFIIAWTIIGIAFLGILCVVAVWAMWLIGRGVLNGRNQNSPFGAPLTKEFKAQNQIEDRIWRDERHYLVEIDGRTNYFRTLEEARLARDAGVVA